MPGINDKNFTEEEDMDQDTPESANSEDDDSELGTDSEGDDSSELDDGDAEQRREEYMFDMSDLERQFIELKEQLYIERIAQIDAKLAEVKTGRAPEYLNPLAQLQESMRIRTQVAGILRELKQQNITNKYEAEKQAAEQNYEIYGRNHTRKEKRKSDLSASDRRRKPVTVTGPYIVYLLKESDVIEDWTTIKKALKQTEKKKKDVVVKAEKHRYSARFDDGKLFYEGDWYSKGHTIIIDNREDTPVRATITAINTGEVWVKREDGNKSKLYIAQLQKGKYTIEHVKY